MSGEVRLIMKRIAVIGGGASGMMAACQAAQRGHRVILFERQKKLGRKLLVTGNGRCNITNRGLDVSRYHGHNPSFVQNVLGRFGLEETVAFFEEAGIPFAEGRDGKLFPSSLQAQAVQRILEYELQRRGVEVLLHRRVDAIRPGKGCWGVITASQENHSFDSVILAAGSCAYPQLGASRSGYELAASLGHTVYEPFPAIVPINIPLKILHRLEGIKWDCRLTAAEGSKSLCQSEGELLFTKYGLSGPVSLDVSRAVNARITEGGRPVLIVDFFPQFSGEELRMTLERLWKDGRKTAAFSLLGILKERMPEVLLSVAGIDPAKTVKTLSRNERAQIANSLKALTLESGSPRSFSEAVVAAGGVDVEEINPASMESKLVENLYLTGELLDIDGDSGGFNLQFAWSTGALAGMAQ